MTNKDQEIWEANSQAVADVYWKHFSIKRDRYNCRKSGFWSINKLKLKILEQHCTGFKTIGVGSTSVDDECLWAALDLDNHESEESTDSNLRYAILVRDRLLKD